MKQIEVIDDKEKKSWTTFTERMCVANLAFSLFIFNKLEPSFYYKYGAIAIAIIWVVWMLQSIGKTK